MKPLATGTPVIGNTMDSLATGTPVIGDSMDSLATGTSVIGYSIKSQHLNPIYRQYDEVIVAS